MAPQPRFRNKFEQLRLKYVTFFCIREYDFSIRSRFCFRAVGLLAHLSSPLAKAGRRVGRG
mgnify:CR=1 FL=1